MYKEKEMRGKKPEENAMRSSRSILPSLRVPSLASTSSSPSSSSSSCSYRIPFLLTSLLLLVLLIVFFFFTSHESLARSGEKGLSLVSVCLSLSLFSLDSPAANLASFDALEYVRPLAPNKRTRSKDTRQAYRHTANVNALHPDNIGRM